MSERDCPDEMAVLWAEREERLRREKLSAHPDCRAPAHPGCSQCCPVDEDEPDLTCPECGGDGMDDDSTPCPHCGGEGYEWWQA